MEAPATAGMSGSTLDDQVAEMHCVCMQELLQLQSAVSLRLTCYMTPLSVFCGEPDDSFAHRMAYLQCQFRDQYSEDLQGQDLNFQNLDQLDNVHVEALA